MMLDVFSVSVMTALVAGIAHEQPLRLAQRLAARARQSDGDLAERLTRSIDDTTAQADITILNAGSAEDHSRELVRVIRSDGRRE